MTGQADYQELVEPYRTELHAHCYRMLGSTQDAEDALQEALTSAWRSLSRFEGRSSLRSWLYRIATNACLKAIERRPRRVLPIDHGPPADPHDEPAEPLMESLWVGPYPDAQLGLDAAVSGPEARYEQREGVELAFIAALQLLPPRQRAVLILRDVLGFSGAEVADALETTPASVYSALQRAHRTVDERLPERSQQATLRALGDERVRDMVDRYVHAWENGDVDGVVALLAEDATLAMPPRPTWYRGRDAVAGFLRDFPLAAENRSLLVPAHINGQLAFGHYFWEAERARYAAHGVSVLTLRGARIADITTFLGPEVFGISICRASSRDPRRVPDDPLYDRSIATFAAAQTSREGRPASGLTALILACAALAAASLLLPASLTYDPWAWLVWGRNVADLDLVVGTAPSWKPLPVLFTTPFSFAGDAAPALWLVVSRTGGLLALGMAARLAARWSPGRLRWLAGCTAAAGLLLVHEYLRRSAVGNVEPLMVAFGLLAIERHLDGHRRQALALGTLAALVRPEIWPFLGAYCIHLWFAERRARALIVSAIALIALLWFGGAQWGSGDAFQPSHVVLTPGRPTPGAQTQHHGLRAFSEFAGMLPLPVVLLAVLGVVLSLRPRSPALGPIALAAGAVAAWVTILAVMVERGYTVIPRYLFLPAALAAILAGVGMARATELVGGTRRLRLAVAIAAAAAVALSVSELRRLRDDADAVASQAERDRDLADAVERAGGAEAVRECGRVVTAWFQKSALAWELGLDLPEVTARDRPGPQITFMYRSPGARARIPAGAQKFETDDWQVVANCRPGRLIEAG